MTAILSENGNIEIPEIFRKADALRAGQRCEIERVGEGEYKLHMTKHVSTSEVNWVEWLLNCPEQDWFEEPDRRELTSLQTPTHFAE